MEMFMQIYVLTNTIRKMEPKQNFVPLPFYLFPCYLNILKCINISILIIILHSVLHVAWNDNISILISLPLHHNWPKKQQSSINEYTSVNKQVCKPKTQKSKQTIEKQTESFSYLNIKFRTDRWTTFCLQIQQIYLLFSEEEEVKRLSSRNEQRW